MHVYIHVYVNIYVSIYKNSEEGKVMLKKIFSYGKEVLHFSHLHFLFYFFKGREKFLGLFEIHDFVLHGFGATHK